MDFVSRVYLSDRGYAKHIEVKTYLLTREQIKEVFANQNLSVNQKSNGELFKEKEVFLLVRVKNQGEYVAFGILSCGLRNQSYPFTLDVEMMPGNMKSFHDSVFWFDKGFIKNNDKLPIIEYKWQELYTL